MAKTIIYVCGQIVEEIVDLNSDDLYSQIQIKINYEFYNISVVMYLKGVLDCVCFPINWR